MTATNITEVGKDGSGSIITGGVSFAAESGSGAKAPVFYLKSPSLEAIIEPGTLIVNPTSVLTRPANTTAYAQFELIASNVTAGSVVVPSFTATRLSAGNTMIRALRLVTNVTTGWGLIGLGIDLWKAAPTFTNGDNGVYAVATGAAGWLGNYQITLTQFGDGAVGRAAIANSYELGVALTSGQLIYWSMQTMTSAAATPISGQTFTLTVEDYQN